jgi:hypothetical protein
MRTRTARRTFIAALTGCALLAPFLAAASADASPTDTNLDPVGTIEVPALNWLGGDGVDVISNGPNGSLRGIGNSTVDGVTAGYKWQCVELPNRLYLTHGWTTSTWFGNGNTMYDRAPAYLARQPQGSITYLAPGDVLSLANGTAGHAAVVNNVTTNPDGSRRVEVVNENAMKVFTYATLGHGTLSVPDNWRGYSVVGVVHSPQASASRVAVARNADGRLEAFTIGPHWEVFDQAQSTPGGTWSSPVRLTGSVGGLAAETNADGRLQLFAVGMHGEVYTRAQATPGSTTWGQWVTLPGNISSLAAARNGDGRLSLLAVGHRGEIYVTSQTSAGAATWSSWVRLDGRAANLTATSVNGRIVVFTVGLTGGVSYRSQTAANGTTWSAATPIDGRVHRLSVARRSDGRLDVFAVGLLGELYERTEVTPGSLTFSGWTRLAGNLSNVAAGLNADGRGELLAIGQLGELYRRQQVTSGGLWASYVGLEGQAHT